jgi:hypothetical protein
MRVTQIYNQKKRYQMFKSKGICVTCCRTPAVEGITRCQKCADRQYKSKRRRLK